MSYQLHYKSKCQSYLAAGNCGRQGDDQITICLSFVSILKYNVLLILTTTGFKDLFITFQDI